MTNPLNNNPEIEHQVDGLIEPLANEGLISGNILIADKGKIAFIKSYGLADRENNTPNAPETIFPIASMTKPITALAIMQLNERNLLNLNDPLNKYLGDFPGGKNITLYHLLTHTSGLPSYDWTRCKTKSQDLETVINWIRELTPFTEPGENFMYSNSGYALLTYVIEKVSGIRYEDYLEENIFMPLGMQDTGLYSTENPVENSACGYSRVVYKGFEKASRPCPMARGDGDLYSTVLDLYKFCEALYKDILVSSSSREKIFTAFRDSYGLGWFIEQLFDKDVVYHPGGELGYMGNMRIFGRGNLIVINLFNTDFLLTHLVEDQLAAIALGKPYQPLFSEQKQPSFLESFRALTGKYPIDETTSFTLSIENGNIFFQESGQPKCLVQPYSENSIYIQEANYRIRFEKNEGDAPKYSGLFGLFLVTGQRENL